MGQKASLVVEVEIDAPVEVVKSLVRHPPGRFDLYLIPDSSKTFLASQNGAAGPSNQ